MKRWMRGLIRGAGLLLLVWILSQVDGQKLGILIGKVDLAQLWAVPLLGLAMTGVRAWRWNMLLRLQKLELPLWRAALLYSSGIFLGSFTPGRLGDLAKGLYLRQDQGVSWEKAMAGALTDRLLDLAVMAALAVWAFFHLGLFSGWVSWAVWGLAGLGLGGWIFALKGRKIAGQAWFSRLRQQQFYQFISGMGLEMRGVVSWAGGWMLGLTFLAYILYFTQTFLLAQAQGLALSAADVSAAIVLVGLASFLPISIAGLGTREGLLIFILGRKGIPESTEAGVIYSMLFFSACFVFPAVVGALCWLKAPLPLADPKNAWR
ncbi:MAG: flippase-like domain-containing protein [Candidatus Latescibacteria bacterium]|nr:flippase-like domain-containing protein [Candidatus Latescibacterota bacterium]